MLKHARFGGLIERVRGKEAILLLLLGVLIRYLWLAERGDLGMATGEAANVAMALARDGAVADPFGRGSGPTTHFVPSMVLVAGSVYSLFGIRSFASELLLSAISIGLSLAGGYLWYRIATKLGVPVKWALIGLGLFCLLPLDFNNQVIGFRAWEGALAVFLGAWFLNRLIDLDRAGAVPLGAFVKLALLSALTFYVNQALGLATYASLGVLLLRRSKMRAWPAQMALAALCLGLVLTPWTLRNYLLFERFIPLRSNFGLELALANHDAAVTSADQRQAFLDRLRAIHPHESQPAFDRMIAVGGEIPYAAELGIEAKSWVSEHHTEFARLSLRHLQDFYFPPGWLYNIYSDTARAVGVRQILTWGISAAGLLAAFLLPFLHGSRSLYLSIAVLIPSLPYLIAQPVPRYRYLVVTPLIFAGVALVGWVATRFAPRGAPA